MLLLCWTERKEEFHEETHTILQVTTGYNFVRIPTFQALLVIIAFRQQRDTFRLEQFGTLLCVVFIH